MVAEGCMSGQECADELMKYINVDTRVSVLGHIQRGGSPSGTDRVLASRLGGHAVDLLIQGKSGLGVLRITNLQLRHSMRFSKFQIINLTMIFMN